MNASPIIPRATVLGVLCLALLPVGITRAQISATTIPVGYQQLAVPAALNASTPVGSVASVPFYNPAAFAGPVTSVDSANTLSSAAANFTSIPFSTAPYLLHFNSGNSVGRYFLVTAANSATQLAVANRGYDLTTIAAAADTFEIVPAFTLGSLFGTSSVPFQTGASASVADNVLLWNGSSWTAYYHDGTSWRKSGDPTNQNTTILYPDEGMYITRRGTAALTLAFLGTTPSTTERSDLIGPGSTFVSNRFPVATTLVNFGLQDMPNWLDSSSASQADTVHIWKNNAWGIYYDDGANWNKSGSVGNVNTQAIPSGAAVFVVRRSTATGTSATLVQTLPYNLN